ncbi:MAG: dehydrogenase E1 component subunit alpha/beta [bacterium]
MQPDLDDDGLRALYRDLLLPRVIEERMLVLLRQGRLSKWFSGMGQEAIAVGATGALRADDWILPLHRNLGVFTTRGVPLEALFRQLFGRVGGFTAGRDRSFHFGTLAHHIVGMISHLGAMLPVGCGLGLAGRLRGEERVALAFVGDGGTSEGDVHEAMNLAAVWALPVIFLIENNQYGLSTPVREQFACARLADRAVGYGMPGVQIDGNDVLAVRATVAEAARRARAGEGPTLIECMTFRMRGHEEASGVAYVPPALFEEWAARDPIARFEAVLAERGILDAAGCAGLRATLADEVHAIAEVAQAAPLPDSTAEAELADVFAASPAAVTVGIAPTGADRDLRYVDAIAEALEVAMETDPGVVLLGQDIAEYGGVFKATQGLLERFGRARVRNTPIIESGALGAALGLALDGLHPMVELQFADFITCGFNQVVNNLAKTHYRWGAPVPVVVRAPHGGGVGAGPFHSQSVEGWFTQVAGLKVVAPATPRDAKGLLLAAFADPNPVVFLEHKKLYRSIRGDVPAGYYTEPLGVARVARAGRDATVVTFGVGVHQALAAADVLAAEGVAIEVVDLRTLTPWDVATVVASVKKTGRALVLHEAPLTGGFGGEIAATLGQAAFEWLDAPVARLGALDTPVPFSPALEKLHSPEGRLVPALRALLAY